MNRLCLKFEAACNSKLYNYCFFSLPSDTFDLANLNETISQEIKHVKDRSVCHVGKKMLDEGIFKMNPVLSVKYRVRSWLENIGAKDITYVTTISFDTSHSVPTQLHGNFSVHLV